MFFVMMAFVILIIRLFYLQVIGGKAFRRVSETNCIRLQRIDPPRGLIFDRNGILLVDNRPSFDLNIILKKAKPLDITLEKLSLLLHIPVHELTSKINRNKQKISSYKPVLLKQDIGRDALAIIETHKFNIPGVEVSVRPIRHYINRYSSAHFIGYLSEINSNEIKSGKYPGCKVGDFVGRFGIEKFCEGFVRGRRGWRQVEVDAAGKVVRILKTVDAVPGYNVYLTIDVKLQKRAEKLIQNLVGAIVAMDPKTGHILALSSSPTFDQNIFASGMSHSEWNNLVSNPFRPMENKVVQAEYPPASIYKIITAIAGLEEGIIDESTTYNCPGYYEYGDRIFRCWKHGGHGNMNVVSALAESCDVFFYHIGQKIGIDRLAWYANACGLGKPTGINLDNEAHGLVSTSAWKKRRTGVAWQGGDTLSVAIGQGYNLVTPLQMAVLTAAIANNGIKHRPIIVKSIRKATLTENKFSTSDSFISKQTISKLPASRHTIDLIKKGLWKVVNSSNGTAANICINGIDISGKTGTAQVVGSKKYKVARANKRADYIKPHAWFAAFAPSDAPKIAVVVIIEHGERGSTTAAPIAQELIKTYLIKKN